MMKKFFLAAAAAALVLAMAACGSTSTTTTVEVTSGTMEIAELNANGLDGLADYLEGNGMIAGTATDMMADIIGAAAGQKYSFTYNGSTVLVELYEFDLDHLDETGEATLASVREKGAITVMEQDVDAVLSASGKYLMLYSDSSTEEANVNQEQRAEELFQEYDEQEANIKVKAKKEASSSQAASSEDASSDADAASAVSSEATA